MAGIAHLGIGLAAKRAAPKANLGVLLLASEALDILWGIFALAGIETIQGSPWSHSLGMALAWSAAGAGLAGRWYRDARTGAAIGLVILSHWALDYISHPMFGSPPDLLLWPGGPVKVGLGLYSALPIGLAAVLELGLVLAGLLLALRPEGLFKKKAFNRK